MIRTKKHILNEINKLRKKKKTLSVELLLLKKAGGPDMFSKTSKVLERELIKLEGAIEMLMWVAHTNEKSLPKPKPKKNAKKKTEKPEA